MSAGFEDLGNNAENGATPDPQKIPEGPAGSPDLSRVSLTPDEMEIGRFINLALAGERFKSEEIREIVSKFRSYPGLFPAVNQILENVEQLSNAYEFRYSLIQGTPPEAIAAAVAACRDITNEKLLQNCWSIFGRNLTTIDELRQERQENPHGLMERIIATVSLVRKLLPEMHFYNTTFLATEVVLTHSRDAKHDLQLLHAVTGDLNKVDPASLADYYFQGHHYICHPDYFAQQDKRRVSETELAVREEFSKQAHHPDFRHIDPIVSSIVQAAKPRREQLISLAGRFARDNQDALCADLLNAAIHSGETAETVDNGLSALPSYDREDLPWAARLLEEVLVDAPALLETAAQRLESHQLDVLERELYSYRLQEHQRKFPEKDLEQVKLEFLTKRSEDSELPNPQELNRACQLYANIKTRGDKLIVASTKELEQQVAELKTAKSEDMTSVELKAEYFSVTRELFKRKFGVYPYNTQLIGILLMIDRHEQNQLNPDPETAPRGVYMQVDTGEGKSLMNALFSSYLAFCDRSVYCGSSNTYLFKRDAAKFSDFYSSLGISSGHFEYRGDKSVVGQPPQILYSSNQDMIFGYLSARLNNQPYFSGRAFDVAMIDEADNLLLDLTSEACRIAHPAEPRFAEETLRAFLNYGQKNKALIADNLPEAIVDFGVRCKAARSEDPIVIGVYLRAAAEADQQVLDEDFVIRDDKIVIVDQNTGRLKHGFQWEHGLHEYVAILHNLPVPQHLRLVAQMSHTPFLKMFKNIFCISGTFGDRTDRSELWDVYRLVGFDVPPHRPCQRVDLPTIFKPDYDDWLETVSAEAEETIASGRPCLTIQHTHRQTVELQEKTKAHKPQLLNDRENTDSDGHQQTEDQLIRNAGQAGKLTIANKVASRGADIRPDEAALAAGGLHVIHDLPENARNEKQMAGRSARQGEPGTRRCIFSSNDKFFRKLPELVRETVAEIAEHYGEDSPELEQILTFARRAHNIYGSLLRRSKLQREEMIQEVLEGYFQKISSTAVELTAKNRHFREHRSISGLVVSLYMQAEWSQAFEDASIQIENWGLNEEQEEIDPENLIVGATVAAGLEFAFESSIGIEPLVASFRSDQVLFHAASSMYQEYLILLARTERSLNRLNRQAAQKVLDDLTSKVDQLAAGCFSEFEVRSWDDVRRMFGQEPDKPISSLDLGNIGRKPGPPSSGDGATRLSNEKMISGLDPLQSVLDLIKRESPVPQLPRERLLYTVPV